jgi:hypothetical protein
MPPATWITSGWRTSSKTRWFCAIGAKSVTRGRGLRSGAPHKPILLVWVFYRQIDLPDKPQHCDSHQLELTSADLKSRRLGRWPTSAVAGGPHIPWPISAFVWTGGPHIPWLVGHKTESSPFWQKRYYDRNVRDNEEFVNDLKYIHRWWPPYPVAHICLPLADVGLFVTTAIIPTTKPTTRLQSNRALGPLPFPPIPSAALYYLHLLSKAVSFKHSPNP